MANDEVPVRPARAAEAADLAKLVNTAYGRTPQEPGWTSEGHLIEGPRISTEQMRERIQEPDSVVLVADDEGSLMGCVHLERAGGDVCEVGMLSVHVDAQGRGLGGRLLAAAEAYARDEMGAERIVLFVLTVREELFPWYERRGYEATGEREPLILDGDQRSRVGPLVFEVLEKEVS